MDATTSFKMWKRGQKLGEGTFGEVYVATHEKTGEVAALKKIKLECEDEGVPGTTLREVSLLKELMHVNVVQLKDVFYMPNENKLYLCFEYCEFDLKKYMKSQQYKLSAECIKSFSWQMLNGLSWCHSHRIFHRDLKPQNVLVDPKKVRSTDRTGTDAHLSSLSLTAASPLFAYALSGHPQARRLWPRARLHRPPPHVHPRGRHPLVPRAGDPARREAVLVPGRYVVDWDDCAGDGDGPPALPGRLGD